MYVVCVYERLTCDAYLAKDKISTQKMLCREIQWETEMSMEQVIFWKKGKFFELNSQLKSQLW